MKFCCNANAIVVLPNGLRDSRDAMEMQAQQGESEKSNPEHTGAAVISTLSIYLACGTGKYRNWKTLLAKADFWEQSGE